MIKTLHLLSILSANSLAISNADIKENINFDHHCGLNAHYDFNDKLILANISKYNNLDDFIKNYSSFELMDLNITYSSGSTSGKGNLNSLNKPTKFKNVIGKKYTFINWHWYTLISFQDIVLTGQINIEGDNIVLNVNSHLDSRITFHRPFSFFDLNSVQLIK